MTLTSSPASYAAFRENAGAVVERITMALETLVITFLGTLCGGPGHGEVHHACRYR